MSSTKDEDRAIAKAARAAIARSSLDISELNIGCVGGFIELTGKVRVPRGGAGMSVRKEFQHLITLVRSVRGVKDCYGGNVTQIET
jgi:hypothetical protein